MTILIAIGTFFVSNNILYNDFSDGYYTANDTIIETRQIPNLYLSNLEKNGKEYAVRIGCQFFSPIFEVYEIQDCKMQNKIQIHFKKERSIWEDVIDTTAAIDVQKNIQVVKYHKNLSLKSQTDVIKRIFERISNDFDLTETKGIFLWLCDFPEEATFFTERYLQLYGSDFNKITRQRCVELLAESNLITIISDILSSHSLKINEMHVDDLMNFPPDENKTLKRDGKAEIPYIISVEIFLDICHK